MFTPLALGLSLTKRTPETPRIGSDFGSVTRDESGCGFTPNMVVVVVEDLHTHFTFKNPRRDLDTLVFETLTPVVTPNIDWEVPVDATNFNYR